MKLIEEDILQYNSKKKLRCLVSDILYIEGWVGYSVLYMKGNRKILFAKNLLKIQQLLAPRFDRLHRKYLFQKGCYLVDKEFNIIVEHKVVSCVSRRKIKNLIN